MRKVKRERGSRRDTFISPQELLAENLTKTVQAFQHHSSCSSFQLMPTTKSMTCHYCRKEKKRRNAGSLLCIHQ